MSVLEELGYDGYLGMGEAALSTELYFPHATNKEALNEIYLKEGLRFVKDILADIIA